MGIAKRDLVSNINFFMNVPVEADGTLGIVDGLSAPASGSHCARNEMFWFWCPIARRSTTRATVSIRHRCA